MKGIFSLVRMADFATLLNAFLGFSSILMAFQGEFLAAAALIFLAAAVDGLDGFLARKTDSGPLGLNLDSLADTISFGAAPAVLAWAQFGWHFWALGGVYLACGILRLARFNVGPKKEATFEGMPIPAAGMIVAVSVLLDEPFLAASLMAASSILMISSTPYPKCRDKRLAPIVLAAAVVALATCMQSDFHLLASIALLVLVVYLTYPLVMALCQQRKR